MLSVIYSPEFLEHDTGYAHPERPARLSAIAEALQRVSWQNSIEWFSPTPPDKREVLSWVRQIHTPDYIERVKHIADKGGGYLDSDTIVSARSYEVALLAVSAWLDGVDRVLASHNSAFVLARPPGTMPLPLQEWDFAYFLMQRSQLTTLYNSLESSEWQF